jgi:uncharacterized membrane protein (GlpM family)
MAKAPAVLTEGILRFVLGGAVVSLFALIGDVVRPKSFAGLFGAAPSVALVSLALMISRHGSDYVSVQITSMFVGAMALFAFSVVTFHLLKRAKMSALTATLLALPVWLVVAFGLHAMVN